MAATAITRAPTARCCCCCCNLRAAAQTLTKPPSLSLSLPRIRTTLQVFVNDEPVQIPKGWSVLQACDAAGIDIPR